MRFLVLYPYVLGPGGAETATIETCRALRAQGHSVDLVTDSTAPLRAWAEQALLGGVLPFSPLEILEMARHADGIIVGNLFSISDELRSMLFTRTDIAPWVTASHEASPKPQQMVIDNWKIALESPRWCGKLVGMWPDVETLFPVSTDAPWLHSILPFKRDPMFGANERQIDYTWAGRTDRLKGPSAFAGACHIIAERGVARTSAIRGPLKQIRGGPYIAHVANRMEILGWTVTRAQGMRGSWRAEHPSGSVLEYTGPYGPTYRPFTATRVYVNTTHYTFQRSHLEYTSIEAASDGAVVVANNEFPDYHYGDNPPVVVANPIGEIISPRSGRKVIAIDDPRDMATYFVPLADAMETALGLSVDIDVRANHDIISRAHDPLRLTNTYLDALGANS